MFHMPNDAGRFQMENPPLQRVIVDLQYPLTPGLILPAGLNDVHNRLRSDFPVMRKLDVSTFTITFGPQQPQIPNPELSARYQFTNSDGYDLQMGATNSTLSLPGPAYRERNQFASLLQRVASAIGEVGQIAQCDRVGVRYINAAPATLTEWVTWFKPEFTGWSELGFVDTNAKRVAMLITQITMPESEVVTAATIRHGYLPDGLGRDLTSSPASTEPSFLVDIDMATDKPTPFNSENIVALFKAINLDIAQYLRHTFTAAGEAQFGVKALPEKEQT
jgi:uncharacterized protein (TIGR04255 family)